MPRILIAFTAVLALAGFAAPALAAPLTQQARKVIEGKLGSAKVMSNAEMALKYCREAERKAAQYDRDPFYGGAIAKCLAQADRHLIDQYEQAVCIHFARALEELQAVRADHPQYSRANAWAESLRKDRAWFGC